MEIKQVNVQFFATKLINHSSSSSYTQKNKNVPSFKSYNPIEAAKLEAELAQKGIKCNLGNDSFVGECTKKVVNIFENLFGRAALPKEVSFEPNSNYAYGTYYNVRDKVCINSNYTFFQTMRDLKDYMQSKPKAFASTHPAQIYVHEFAHAAHWHHLENTLGFTKANEVWREFEGKQVPTYIGKLLTKFKLGNYALKANDMCEFAAERITHDVCSNITSDTWNKTKSVDTEYSDLFDRRKTAKYLYHMHEPAYYTDENSPQAYLDRFMQYTWNGDELSIDFANNKLGEALEYLKWGNFIKNKFF